MASRLRIVGLVLAFAAIAVLSGLAVHYIVGPAIAPAEAQPAATLPATPGTEPSPAGTPPAANGNSVFEQIFGPGDTQPEPHESWPSTLFRIIVRLALAAALATMLAYRPRKDVPGILRNPFVAQTQILLAVVASALMMIVGDNAARAFGIFAAASLVRFRTNISDPKEITVLLIGLAIGLATGVGRLELAIALALFMLLLLFVLEYFEPGQLFRSMELRVSTRNVDATGNVLQRIMERYKLGAEMREVKREDEADPVGRIVYHVNVRGNLSTDRLSEEIFTADADHVDGVEWQHSKSNSYIYR